MITKTTNTLRQPKTCALQVHVTAHILAALNVLAINSFNATNVFFFKFVK
jgi:hypothetical protein